MINPFFGKTVVLKDNPHTRQIYLASFVGAKGTAGESFADLVVVRFDGVALGCDPEDLDFQPPLGATSQICPCGIHRSRCDYHREDLS